MKTVTVLHLQLFFQKFLTLLFFVALVSCKDEKAKDEVFFRVIFFPFQTKTKEKTEEEEFFGDDNKGEVPTLDVYPHLIITRKFLTDYLVAGTRANVSYYFINEGNGYIFQLLTYFSAAYNVNITEFVVGISYNGVIPEIAAYFNSFNVYQWCSL